MLVIQYKWIRPAFWVTALLFGVLFAGAQEKKADQRHFALYLGAGPNFYFNNVVTGKDLVNEWNYSVVARLMWEPEHFLSLGIESGYNLLYTADGTGQAQVHIVNSAVPIHLALSMKIIKAWYLDFSMGPSLLSNKVHSDTYGDFDGSSLSLADFSGSLTYRFAEKGRLRYSLGPKFFYSSHLNDKNIALVFMLGYRL